MDYLTTDVPKIAEPKALMLQSVDIEWKSWYVVVGLGPLILCAIKDKPLQRMCTVLGAVQIIIRIRIFFNDNFITFGFNKDIADRGDCSEEIPESINLCNAESNPLEFLF